MKGTAILAAGVLALASGANAEQVRKPRAPLPNSPQNDYPQWCNNQGQVAVAFAEGPSPYTTTILQQLDGLNVSVNFFPTATFLNDIANSVPLQVAAQKGYFIGQRLATSINPMDLSDSDLVTQLTNECQKIQQLTNRVPKYIMLPDGQVDARVDGIVKSMGYVPIRWNVDTLDWNATYNGNIQSCSQITNIVRRALWSLPAGWGKWILLAHDLYQCTALAIPDIFGMIAERKYEAVDMGKCFDDPKPYRDSCSGSGPVVPPAPITSSVPAPTAPVRPTSAAPQPTTTSTSRSAAPSSAMTINAHSATLLAVLLAVASLFVFGL